MESEGKGDQREEKARERVGVPWPGDVSCKKPPQDGLDYLCSLYKSDQKLNVLCEALEVFGQSIRASWGDIDGRDVRNGIESMIEAIKSDKVPTLNELLSLQDICPEHKMWTWNCDDAHGSIRESASGSGCDSLK